MRSGIQEVAGVHQSTFVSLVLLRVLVKDQRDWVGDVQASIDKHILQGSGVFQQGCVAMVHRHLQMSPIQRRHRHQRLESFDHTIEVGRIAGPHHAIHSRKDKPEIIY